MNEMVEQVLIAIREAVVFSETSGGVSIANAEEVARAAVDATADSLRKQLALKEEIFGAPKDVAHLLGRIDLILDTRPGTDMYDAGAKP